VQLPGAYCLMFQQGSASTFRLNQNLDRGLCVTPGGLQERLVARQGVSAVRTNKRPPSNSALPYGIENREFPYTFLLLLILLIKRLSAKDLD
jgi:hypothetical protein